MKNKYGLKSLSIKLPLILSISFILLSALVTITVFFKFRSQMLNEYERMSVGVTDLMKKDIKWYDVENYLQYGSSSSKYLYTVNELIELYKSYPDIHYMYVYQIKEDGGHVVFDIFTEDGEIQYDEPGGIYEIDFPFSAHLDEILAGEEVPSYEVVDGAGEHLYSYITPILDDKDNYVCSVCVDFSMMHLYNQDMQFLFQIIVMIALLVGLLIAVDIYLIRKDIISPLASISECTGSFKYDTEADRMKDIQMLESLNIHQENEIDGIYNVFLRVLKDSFYYMTKLEKAKYEIRKKEERINYLDKKAFMDDLTGVGNKSAYNEVVIEINEKIKNGEEELNYAVLMIDINNLKYVNDTYGHEKGDDYIKGCCAIIRSICAKSPIYRIGGDEFVAILQEYSFDICQQISAKLMIAFNRSYKDNTKEEAERYSAAIGLAKYKNSDTEFNDAFSRADFLMYSNKNKFKKQNGSYR